MKNIGDKVAILFDGRAKDFVIDKIHISKEGNKYDLSSGIFETYNRHEEEFLTKAQVRDLEKLGMLKPKDNEKYWLINKYGRTTEMTWRDDLFDITSYELGNCYRTFTEVEFALQKQKYLTQYKRYVEERNDKFDWKDASQTKYYAYFGIYTCKITIGNIRLGKNQGTIYATSEQTILNFIELIGEDNFKKYILEVEE